MRIWLHLWFVTAQQGFSGEHCHSALVRCIKTVL